MEEQEIMEQELQAEPEQERPMLMREALEAERRALEAEKAAFARQKLERLVAAELAERGLSEEFADFLTGEDEAESLDRVERFEALFQQSLKAEIARRMRGKGAPREPAKPKGISRESLRSMSAKEINARWEEIAGALKK